MEIKKIKIQKYNAGHISSTDDFISVEEPLEISLYYFDKRVEVSMPVSVTMRTPGHDKELAIGFLFTESIIQNHSQIVKIEQFDENKIGIYIHKDVILSIDKLKRNFYTSSSCGVCGKASLEAVRTIVSASNRILNTEYEDVRIASKTILSLKEKINSHQSNFSQTGGIHASALFDVEGNLISIFEDIGRHNALDKLIGHYFLKSEMNLEKYILLLSGRACFELIQKAATANIKTVCAIGAPSSLAVELAEEFDITLIGFLKENSFNIYSSQKTII